MKKYLSNDNLAEYCPPEYGEKSNRINNKKFYMNPRYNFYGLNNIFNSPRKISKGLIIDYQNNIKNIENCRITVDENI